MRIPRVVLVLSLLYGGENPLTLARLKMLVFLMQRRFRQILDSHYVFKPGYLYPDSSDVEDDVLFLESLGLVAVSENRVMLTEKGRERISFISRGKIPYEVLSWAEYLRVALDGLTDRDLAEWFAQNFPEWSVRELRKR